MCIYRDFRKSGAFHIRIKKNWVSHILFVEKRGPIIYLAALKKGAIRHAHPYYAIYRKLHSPPPPPRPEGKDVISTNQSKMFKCYDGFKLLQKKKGKKKKQKKKKE